MTKLVLDASVVLEWLAQGKQADASLKIHKAIIEGKVAAWAPDFLLVEIANILFWKKKFASKDIQQFIETIINIGIHFDDEPNYLHAQTMIGLMDQYRVTAYDAQYLCLAKKLECNLVSFDKQLLTMKDLVISPNI